MLRRVGLLGGSFNPAHEGHRYLSEQAIKRLNLNQVWWLIAPKNPLKSRSDLAPLEKRLNVAEVVADHPQIRVTDIERKIGTAHTVDTVRIVRARFPDIRFVWLMGADILLELPRWKQWRRLFSLLPIAVFPRPTYSLRALSSVAARSFAGARVPQQQAFRLAEMEPPAWVFLQVRPHGESASRIRAQRAKFSADTLERKSQPRRESKSSPETQTG